VWYYNCYLAACIYEYLRLLAVKIIDIKWHVSTQWLFTSNQHTQKNKCHAHSQSESLRKKRESDTPTTINKWQRCWWLLSLSLTYQWFWLIQAQKVYSEIWKLKNTHSGLGHYVTGRIPWLLSYLTEIGISRNAFFTHQMKMLFLDKKKSLERKCRKVCSIFFNQISVNVTYTQRRFAVLINNASREPPQ